MRSWCAEQKFSFTSRIVQYVDTEKKKKKKRHFANDWMLGNSNCQLVLVKDQEAISFFRIVSFYSSPVVDALSETMRFTLILLETFGSR